jgi:hypothetical protein
MVYWITGKKDSGKTHYADALAQELREDEKQVVILDGDGVRKHIKAGFSDEERHAHIMRIAMFAAVLEDQGVIVIIALVSPRREWREEARNLFKESVLIYLPGGTLWKDTTYDVPDEMELGYHKKIGEMEWDNAKIMPCTNLKDEEEVFMVENPGGYTSTSIIKSADEPNPKAFSMMIGRFQPWHNGHAKMAETIIKEGKKVCIAIRNTPINERNPLNTVEVIEAIHQDMISRGYMRGHHFTLTEIPDMNEIVFGRRVGWGVREIRFDQETESISATKIRAQAAADIDSEKN